MNNFFKFLKGAVKANNNKVRAYVKSKKSDDDQIIWGPDINSSDKPIPTKNGFKNQVIVNFLTPNNGRQQIVETCKEIATHVGEDKVTLDDITPEFIDKELRKSIWGLPDPDLVLYFGRICVTYGLLPWHIRVTEFVSVPPQLLITVTDYLKALHRFAKTEQRFGK